ncbi:MAG TPA: LytR C-terminal domain-containing protein [Candidatus Limnocylindria bacterium]|nr:LytR C-terminal domain-containing protein [Candidatus Limnocylindria bacterium]
MILRVVVGILALSVAALGLSWAYATFWPKREAPVAGPARRVIRVQVLNGSGEIGIGARVAAYLREGGFHVVQVDNADRSDYFATLVVARRGEPDGATAVARYLGSPPVIRQAWGSDVADVTVVLGSDRSRLRFDD